MSPLPLMDHFVRESKRFRDSITVASPTAKVATCPGWSADDLLAHLARVQWFWGAVVASDARTHDAVAKLPDPILPTGHTALLDFFDVAHARLRDAFEDADPHEPRWMWTADPALHTVGYILRRQTHEALVHRVDAEMVAGTVRAPIPAVLTHDGIDEILTVMYGARPASATFSPTTDATVELTTTDSFGRWDLQLGRLRGEHAGEPIDIPAVAVVSDEIDCAASVSGTAADLDLWLWSRPPAGRV